MRRFISRLSRGSGPLVAAVVYDSNSASDMRFTNEYPARDPISGEIQVKLLSASLNPIDFKIPHIPGISWVRRGQAVGVDFCGEVCKVGDPSSRFKIGDKVFGMAEAGSLIELATVPESHSFLLPSSLSASEGAAYPSVALTALQALRYAGIKVESPGIELKNILILGSSGGVGHSAVQLAKISGAKVTAVCSSKNEEFVRSLGADVVVCYDKCDLESTLIPKSFDVVFDFASHPSFTEGSKAVDYEPLCWAMVQPEGQIVATTTAHGNLKPFLGIINHFTGIPTEKRRYHFLTVQPSQSDFALVAKLVEEKKFQVHISEKFPLTAAGVLEAFEKLRTVRTVGKIIIQPNSL